MLALLPLAAWALGYAALRNVARERGEDWRWAFLSASVLWGIALAAGTELLGALGLFGRGPLALFWTGTLLFAAARLRRSRGAGGMAGGPTSTARPDALIVAAVVLLAAILVAALAAAPNSWDSMTYHLSRVFQWLDHRSVAHYPTHVLRQLFMPPGGEYAIAHLASLAGGDRFANLPQWLALVGSAVGVSRIARQLGGGPPAQVLAAVFAVTLPMSVVQGSSSQNDLVVAFWLVAFVSFLLPLHSRAAPAGFDGFLGVASFGLAVLTKGTAPLYAAPFLAVFAATFLAARRKARWKALAAGIAVATAVNLPHAWRNQAVFGAPWGPPAGVLAEDLGPRAVASGVLRNAGIHLALPSAGWNERVEAGVRNAHAAIGADPDDPRTTWRGSRFHVPPVPLGAPPPDADEAIFLMLHEGYATSPLHFLLAAASLALAARRGRPALLYAAACAAAFLLFCLVLKWQPWHARLHLPGFLLAAPLVGLAWSLRPALGRGIGAVLVLVALPALLVSPTRPLLGPDNVFETPRIEQYFASRPDLKEPFLERAGRLPKEPCPVGLRIGPDDGEYLIRAALRAAGHPPRPLVHVEVRNASAASSGRLDAVPCASWDLSAAPRGQERDGAD
ncbi:MAG: ArnT family glycosyltransferase [Thermoanaerobaculia bacterium]